MNKKITFLLSIITILLCDAQKIDIKIILGSTRQGRTSDKLGNVLKSMADKNPNVNAEIIDLRDYNLPFLSDATPPASREKIEDPIIKGGQTKLKKLTHLLFSRRNITPDIPGF